VSNELFGYFKFVFIGLLALSFRSIFVVAGVTNSQLSSLVLQLDEYVIYQIITNPIKDNDKGRSERRQKEKKGNNSWKLASQQILHTSLSD